MTFAEEVKNLSKGVNQERRIEACKLFFNGRGAMSHYNALKAIGIDADTLNKMDEDNVIWYWRQDLLSQGIIKEICVEGRGDKILV